MKRFGYRSAVLLAVFNAPALAYSVAALSAPASVGGFRVWAAATMALALAMHLGAAFVMARWLRALGGERRAAAPRDILRGFRGQCLVALGLAAALWWLSYRVAAAVARRTPSQEDLAPLSTYGWLAVLIVLALGSLTAVVVAFRETALPIARVSPKRETS